MLVDLHIHSTASDGTDPPARLGPLAAAADLGAIALTDHDTTAGLAGGAAGCAEAGVRFIPGIELSADPAGPPGTMHILGYFVRAQEPRLLGVCRRMEEARRDRNPRIVAMLERLGVPITLEQVQRLAAGGVVGRPHIAAALVESGHVPTIEEAFRRYIGRGGAAYARRDRLPAEEAIATIHAAGGLAVLAHPIQLGCADEAELESAVRRLVDAGLDGLEVFHPDHGPAHVTAYESMARRFGLIRTGGSDYHGRRKATLLGSHAVPRELYEALLAAREARVGR